MRSTLGTFARHSKPQVWPCYFQNIWPPRKASSNTAAILPTAAAERAIKAAGARVEGFRLDLLHLCQCVHGAFGSAFQSIEEESRNSEASAAAVISPPSPSATAEIAWERQRSKGCLEVARARRAGRRAAPACAPHDVFDSGGHGCHGLSLVCWG